MHVNASTILMEVLNTHKEEGYYRLSCVERVTVEFSQDRSNRKYLYEIDERIHAAENSSQINY